VLYLHFGESRVKLRGIQSISRRKNKKPNHTGIAPIFTLYQLSPNNYLCIARECINDIKWISDKMAIIGMTPVNNNIGLIDFWCLTPLSAIFQLYHGNQF
jgi:hypothetical protein